MANIIYKIQEATTRALGLAKTSAQMLFYSRDTKNMTLKDTLGGIHDFSSNETIANPSNNFASQIGVDWLGTSSNVKAALDELYSSVGSSGAFSLNGVYFVSNYNELKTALEDADFLDKHIIFTKREIEFVANTATTKTQSGVNVADLEWTFNNPSLNSLTFSALNGRVDGVAQSINTNNLVVFKISGVTSEGWLPVACTLNLTNAIGSSYSIPSLSELMLVIEGLSWGVAGDTRQYPVFQMNFGYICFYRILHAKANVSDPTLRTWLSGTNQPFSVYNNEDFSTLKLYCILDSSGAKVPVDTLDIYRNYLKNITGGTPAWGSITGTLSSQTDLQNALNAKQNSLPNGTNNNQYLGWSGTSWTNRKIAYSEISGTPTIPSNYWTTDSSQNGLTGDKTTTGLLNFGGGTLTGQLVLASSTTAFASLRLGAYVAVPTTPVDGDIFRSSTTGLQMYSSGSAKSFAFQNMNNTFSGNNTFSNTTTFSHATAAISITGNGTITQTGTGTWTLAGTLNGTTSSWSGAVSAATTPTLSAHLINKNYGDTTYAPISGSANYWTSTGAQTGLSGDKTTSGFIQSDFVGTAFKASNGFLDSQRTDNTSNQLSHFRMYRGNGTSASAYFTSIGDTANGIASIQLSSSLGDLQLWDLTTKATTFRGKQNILTANNASTIEWLTALRGSGTGNKMYIGNTGDALNGIASVGIYNTANTALFTMTHAGLAAFSGNVTSSTAPTLGAHLINLTYANANYLRLDGTSTTSASIPFAQGLSIPTTKSIAFGLNTIMGESSTIFSLIGSRLVFGSSDTTNGTSVTGGGLSIVGSFSDGSALRILDNSWIRPQTAGQSIYITNTANPGANNLGASMHLTNSLHGMYFGDGTNKLAEHYLQNGSIYTTLFSGANVKSQVIHNTSSLQNVHGQSGQTIASLSLSADSNVNLAFGAKSLNINESGFQLNGVVTGTIVAGGYLGFDASNNIVKSTSGGGSSTIKTLFTQSPDVVIANTTTESSLLSTGVGSKTISANTLTVGSVIRIKASGYIKNTGSPFCQVKIKLGSTVIADTTLTGMFAITGSQQWSIEGEFTVKSIGGSATIIGQSIFYYATSASTQEQVIFTTNTSTSTFDSTANQTIDLTYQWNTANANNSITTNTCYLEQLN